MSLRLSFRRVGKSSPILKNLFPPASTMPLKRPCTSCSASDQFLNQLRADSIGDTIGQAHNGDIPVIFKCKLRHERLPRKLDAFLREWHLAAMVSWRESTPPK